MKVQVRATPQGVALLVRGDGRGSDAYHAAMSLVQRLATAIGLHVGTGDGTESGPFLARIHTAVLPNGGVVIDYEATSAEHGLQHHEHTLLVPGPDGRDQLYVAHSESPFVTVMTETADGSGRFEPAASVGPFDMAIVIDTPTPGELTYAWWWAPAGQPPTEQSRATVRLVTVEGSPG